MSIPQSYKVSQHLLDRHHASEHQERKRKAPVPATFLDKLRQILQQPERYGGCIAWVNDGYAVEIKDEDDFSKGPLLDFFEHTNFHSFIRQLNLYGFRKTQRKLNERIYKHEKFNQHEPELAKDICRKRRRTKAQRLNEMEEENRFRQWKEEQQQRRAHDAPPLQHHHHHQHPMRHHHHDAPVSYAASDFHKQVHISTPMEAYNHHPRMRSDSEPMPAAPFVDVVPKFRRIEHSAPPAMTQQQQLPSLESFLRKLR